MKKRNYLFLSLILMVLVSCDNQKIQPGFSGKGEAGPGPSARALVEKQDIVQMYEAVGTIRPLTESVIESQVSAQVLKVFFTPGTSVQEGDVLIRLDNRQLMARVKQAGEGLSLAKNNLEQTLKSMDEASANLDQTKAAYERTQKLFKSDIVPVQKLEIDKAAYLQSKARLEKSREGVQSAKASIRQAEQVVKEARIALGYAEIKAPASGIVAQRMTDPGDQAIPGKPLMIIQTSGALRLEASVREGLISRVSLGGDYQVKIETVDKTVNAKIEEIVPYADPATRTFLVKAALPHTPGIYPGMFGRLMIPVGRENTLVVPREAVIRVGQLEQILVLRDKTWQRVYVKTGKILKDKIEVLAGLSGNETIGWERN
ncbi:efflux RND transporter periplasmic adaptor subunit [Desulfospira joergensenii]|uniref:efflux RND transporter periplasmic adaptor subunit n=1 Tax=Desulfospira joergensenii TaxID=53329 RepID=UPI0003B6CEDE|nr:efflux RND transporter periplasmic adaptor subunit [Desulfospira joergensenii]